MGIHEKPAPALLEKLSRYLISVRAKTVTTPSAQFKRCSISPDKVFFAMGGNFATATPDTPLTHRALQNCALTVHVTTKLNRSHLVCGREALILPCLGALKLTFRPAGRKR
jgi:anaerobic selenocysteine-containing dehydrogenase